MKTRRKNHKKMKENAELFLKLYRKYLDLEYNKIVEVLETLPANVIEWAFNDIEFVEKGFDLTKLEETRFGFGGLCGYERVLNLGIHLNNLSAYQDKGVLEEFLKKFGCKTNYKSVGVL